jgi:uridine kinase
MKGPFLAKTARKGPFIARELTKNVLRAKPRLGDVRMLAIDGPSGAGKSTLAAAVREELSAHGTKVTLISTDDFATWDEPVAWWPRLENGVLEPLARGRPGGYRRMDWTTGSPRLGAEITVPVPDVLVLEGVSAGRASVRSRLSWLCFLCGPPEDERLKRSVGRDGEESRDQLRAWQRFERGWFAVDQTNRHADSSLGVVDVRYGC